MTPMCSVKYLLAALLLWQPAAAGAGSADEDPPRQGGGSLVRLSLKEAIEAALAPEGNASARLASEAVRLAEARSAQSRASLLPHVEASVTQQNLTRNLEAFGIRLSSPAPGVSIPPFVGPFNVFDARAAASQTVLDFGALRRFQAARAGVLQAQGESETVRDQVRAQAARAYLHAVRAEARLETVRANVTLSEALLKLAQDQKAAGTGTAIDVTRARVQLANERQRLLVAENEHERAQLELLKLLGLRLDARLELAEGLSYKPVEAVTLEQAVGRALELRADWQAQEKREETLRLQQSAARMDRLPSLTAFADYGSIGTSTHNAVPTRVYGVTLRIPVFDGGRIEARRGESTAQYLQEKIRTRDLRQQIELEIRLALAALRSAEEQVKTAEEGLALAEEELAQAERRYSAGMAPGIEVTDAQTRLQRARENRLDALFSHSLARVDLAAAMGTIRNVE